MKVTLEIIVLKKIQSGACWAFAALVGFDDDLISLLVCSFSILDLTLVVHVYEIYLFLLVS